ncbi:CHAT domain-containing protein [Nonomuraea jiangxiensis]|uniref:CHAT domain-containing protein n=1 Tax=Nonomuraea jiangxiensis TaxID=633440 RepID=A0A1G8JP83_9ACTN|nr:CHAT domain-containing protein [Nonomuraea jiangxiensis]SDI32996.1 CHAT domain-containing protein [Nonomuraea jiangxiensis]
MREELLAALRARFATVSRTGDGAGVVGPEALAEAERLLDFLAAPEGVDHEVLYTAGLLHWMRAVFLPGEQGRQAWSHAARLLLPLYLARPDALPEQVRSFFAQAYGQDEPAGEERAHASAEALSDLAMFLLERFTRLRRPADGEAATALLRRATRVLPAGHPARPVVLSNLGYALLLGDALMAPEHESTRPPNVDEAVTVLREALQDTPREHPNHARCANGLALAVRAKGLATRDLALLAEAVDLFRLAVDTATAADGNRPRMLTDLGSSLLIQAAGGAGPAGPAAPDEAVTALDEAVAVLREAVRDTPEGAAERRERLRLLARAERLRASQAPRPARAPLSPETRRRVEELTGLMRRTIPATSDGTPDEPDNWLAVAARLIGVAPSDGQGHHAQLLDLAARLLRDPAGTDVEREAADFYRRRSGHLSPGDRLDTMLTRILAPPGTPPAPADPSHLADLDEVLALHERVLRELPDDLPERASLEIGQLMTQLARQRHDLADPDGTGLEESLALLTRTMKLLPSLMASLNLSATMVGDLAVMGGALLSPFESLSMIEDGLKRNRAKLAGLPPGHPERTTTLKALTHTLFLQYQLTHEEPVYQEAAGLARRIAAADLAEAVRIVLAWGVAARLRATSAAPPGEPDPRSSGLARLSSEEAATAIENRDAPAALETLEEGRAHMLSSALNARRELANLRAADPRLATRFLALREQVRATVAEPVFEPGPEELARTRGLAQDWSELVGQVQALPAFGRFLMPLPLGAPDLRPSAAEGPVVTINVNPRRCDALALCADGVRLVPLPGLRAAELVEQAEAFHAAIRVVHGAPGPLAGQAERVLLDTLGWLWDVLAEPVLTELGLTGPPGEGPWPRLWWSPAGALNSLPLHAAGHHTIAGASVLDRAVSSYTPTVRALLHSRARPVPPRRTGLTVAMPVTPGHAALPETAGEAAEVTARIHGRALVGAQASRAAVLAALPGASVAHFACHAGGDPYEPSASHLLLHDGPLSVTEIGRLDLDGAELAYLSACATARGGARLADEALHLASAFQLAGYAQAVATLWEIGDHAAATMAADFHRELGESIGDPAPIPGALALHTATRRMRAAIPGRPSAWAAFLHAGA